MKSSNVFSQNCLYVDLQRSLLNTAHANNHEPHVDLTTQFIPSSWPVCLHYKPLTASLSSRSLLGFVTDLLNSIRENCLQVSVIYSQSHQILIITNGVYGETFRGGNYISLVYNYNQNSIQYELITWEEP
jgi:hypothetical protein